MKDVSINNDSNITLEGGSKIGVGFIGINSPVDNNDAEAQSGASFFTPQVLDDDAKKRSVAHIQTALQNAVNAGGDPVRRYVSLPDTVKDALDFYDESVNGNVGDYVRGKLIAGAFTSTGDGNDLAKVGEALNRRYALLLSDTAVVSRVVEAVIAAKSNPVAEYGTIPEDVRLVLASVDGYFSYNTDSSIVGIQGTLEEYVQNVLTYRAYNTNDNVENAVNAGLNDGLNAADLRIVDSTINMKGTSAIVNEAAKSERGDILVSGASAVNVRGGTEAGKYNTITAYNNIAFTDAAALTVSSASKLNMTAMNGGVSFAGTGAVTINAGATVNLTADEGVTYSKSGALVIGSATQNAGRTTLSIRSGAVDSGLRKGKFPASPDLFIMLCMNPITVRTIRPMPLWG